MPTDLDYMQLALEEARSSANAGEVPIGAVLVREDKSSRGRAIARFATMTLRPTPK